MTEGSVAQKKRFKPEEGNDSHSEQMVRRQLACDPRARDRYDRCHRKCQERLPTWERSVSFKGNILSRERLGSRCYQRLSQVAISSFATRFSLNLNRCSS